MKVFKILIPLLISVLLVNCATNDLTIRVTEPAPVSVPASVNSIGILNRTQSTGNKAVKKLEEILSLELKKVDSLAAIDAARGLESEFEHNQRFDEVVNLHPQLLKNNASNIFSPKLSPNTISGICTKNNLDALFVLEYLDTDTEVSYKAVPVKTKVLGIEVDAVETQANVRTLVRIGWRIYDAQGTPVYDEFKVHKNVHSSGRGINPMKAIAAIAGQNDRIKTESFNMGKAYANDLMPYSRRVHRIYYVKGTNNFKIGKRLARAGSWNDAADYWDRETDNPKGKIAGRAYYNMAIINEINGNLAEAMDWAEKSYTLFNNKKALRYLNILKARQARIEELKRQTEE